jgi:hypothetical protein
MAISKRQSRNIPASKTPNKILNPGQSKVPSVSCHSSLAFLLCVCVPKSLQSLEIRTNLVYSPLSIAQAFLFASSLSLSLSLSLYSQKVKLKTKIGKIKSFLRFSIAIVRPNIKKKFPDFCFPWMNCVFMMGGGSGT